MKFYRFIAAFLFFCFFLKYMKLKKLANFDVPYCFKFKFCFLLVFFACKDPSFKSSKRRNQLRPENLETLFPLSALTMPVTSYQGEIKYLEYT